MFDVTTFLMRWMFLSNILRNVAEIQTFPQQLLQHDAHQPPSSEPQDVLAQEEHWRNHCLQTILSYPPGGHRLLMADAYRVELVQKLAQKLSTAQECLRLHKLSKASNTPKRIGIWGRRRAKHTQTPSLSPEKDVENVSPTDTDPDADVDLLKAFQQQSRTIPTGAQSPDAATGASTGDAGSQKAGEPDIPDITLSAARERLKEIREYLPQLVSAALKSPPAVESSIADPVHLLKQFLLERCSHDPSWGIELCWLLEADVGRAWKALLEHPQQTGRRLLVILPAEKAAVMAKIGHEKAAAFDLLQEAEYATAYGSSDPSVESEGAADHQWTSRLPSSLSQRRCAHFGDTMHFIDRLTKLSLDLRRVPTLERHTQLHEGLQEVNRRMRRRMATKGEMSLDVEDNCGPEDWPRVEDLKTDMLQHSVHFPLMPQTGTWPTGEDDYVPTRDSLDVVRVLNIVVPESRLLSSRERCPFLVQLEVADTNIEGHDARLYSSGPSSVGSTIEEALSLNAMEAGQRHSENNNQRQNVAYNIPEELFASSDSPRAEYVHALKHEFPRGGSVSDQAYPYQGDDLPDMEPQQYPPQYHGPEHCYDPTQYPEQIAFQDENVAYGFPDPANVARQHEVHQLHQQMHRHQESMQTQHQQHPPPTMYETEPTSPPVVSTGKELLDAVFGEPFSEQCKAIKESSPFGKVDGWRLASFIMKAGEDIRKESLVMQIISRMRTWFEEEISPALRPYMRPYTIMCVGGDAGLVECLSDAKSVDELKKKTDNFESLLDFFIRAYGEPGTTPSDPDQITFEQAQENFLRSLVGYSLVCYVLQIKDRHNANILMDRQGHIMHIDFGFVLGETPKMAKVPIFQERAPFKLSAEFWDVLGGWNTRGGGLGVQFCKMFEKAFACASNHAEEIATMVESTMLGLNHNPHAARILANGVRSRLRMRGPPGSEQQQRFIVELVSAARASWGTSTYDWLQKNMNGYQ